MTPTRPKSDVRKLWPLVNPEGSDPPNVVSPLEISASKIVRPRFKRTLICLINSQVKATYGTMVDI